MSSNTCRELSIEELDQVSGGLKFGPFSFGGGPEYIYVRLEGVGMISGWKQTGEVCVSDHQSGRSGCGPVPK